MNQSLNISNVQPHAITSRSSDRVVVSNDSDTILPFESRNERGSEQSKSDQATAQISGTKIRRNARQPRLVKKTLNRNIVG